MLNFFNKQPKKKAIQPLFVDFHSHFLPGLDDGCTTLEESITLIQQMKNYGYQKLIMSPHNMGDFYKNTPEIIVAKLAEVKKAVMDSGIDIQLEATAEYYLDEWFEEKLKTKSLLPFGGNKILFEISYINEPKNLFDTLFKLQVAGYQPIMAHPERYSFFHSQFDVYEKLILQGCQLQVNLLSLIGYYGVMEKKVATELLEKKMVAYLCSDAHKQKHVELLAEVFKSNLFRSSSQQIKNNELF